MSRIYPIVERLQIHLRNMQMVQFNEDQSVSEIIGDERNTQTQLTEYFIMNRVDHEARNYLYIEFPLHYTWVKKSTRMEEKEKSEEVAMRRGLLENDDIIRQCLQEASTFCSPVALRRLFVTILLYCQPTDTLLSQHGKHIVDYDLPALMDDSEGGTRKTFLYHVLLSSVRKIGMIALAMASSGIAATILLGGRTAYSRFKIPLSVDAVDKSVEHNCHMTFL
ncbi:ATP-dependent DNA helicase PIF1 [Senna tora]|uniref:ATP-dependent DNA helicase n=1 Tax=Senna tora TaxID=362788 RepID=A0A834WTT7_9FABA|nr:ATP-dependent DNA helicase PIF1 [Senna tora]